MSSLGDAIGRKTHGRDPVRAAPAGKLQPASARGAGEGGAGSERCADDRSELRRRRDALAEQVAELHWDLGGLTYEMAIRDHFRLDVLVRRAAILQERDAELAELERLLALEDSASVGACTNCGAPHSRGAAFCWQCGSALMERIPSSVVPSAVTDGAGEQESTVVMQALLAPEAGRSPAEG
jgi:hypothetical protein